MTTSALKAVATGKADGSANPLVAFRAMLESRKNEIGAALPRHITPDRVIRLALTEFSKNPGLRECTMQSIYSGIIQASQLGLEIGVLGQAYLVPYNNKIKATAGKPEHWRKEAQFIPGYKGLISLARRSGEVTSIETHIVYANDAFDLTLGISSVVKHKPFLDGDRGAPKLVYGVAHFKDGGYHFEWMSIAEVSKIRNRSKAKDNGPWVTDFDQMVRKTLVRRMANYLPMSIELAAALQVDDAASAGKAAAIDGEFNVITADDDDAGEAGAAAEAGVASGTDALTAAGESVTAAPDAAADQTLPQADKKSGKKPPAATEQPPLTYAQVLGRMQSAYQKKDLGLLDVEADLIRSVADAQQREELGAEYLNMRELLTSGDA